MRIDVARMVSIKPELVELLKSLDVGDTLKGRVLEALANSIVIRSSSGEVFTALLQEGTKIPKGSFIELTVSSIVDGKIYAEIKGEGKVFDLDAKLSELLRELSLPVDENNIEAAKLLLKYKLPLDKKTIMNITGLQKSVDNLNQSSEGKVGLLLSDINIKDTPVDVLNKIVLNWSSDFVDREAFEAAAEKTDNTDVPGIIVPKEEDRKGSKSEAAIINKQVVKADSKDESTGNPKEIISINKSESNEIHKKVIKYIEPVIGEGTQTVPKDSTAASEDNKAADLIRILDRLGIETGSEVKRFAGYVEDILASIKSTDMEAIAYLVSKEMKITPKNLGMLIKNIENSDGISQFLDKLQHRIAAGNNPELKAIKESIRKIFLEPREIEDGKEVALKLKNMAKLGEKLESYLSRSEDYDPEIRNALYNLKDSIDFICNINEHSNFFQLPIIINGDTAAAKLYVFKEGKRNKAIDPQDATVVIALDLVSLGHLESMIRVKGKTVNVTFRVNNKNTGAVIEKNVVLLKESLEEKGYNLSLIRVITLEQPFSLLSLDAIINESGTEKIHFDMRV